VRDRVSADTLIQNVRKTGRTLLNEYESKKILQAYAIPTVETRMAYDEEEAVRIAEEIGYPIVIKLASNTIAHKAKAGGVVLNVSDAAAARNAFRKIQSTILEKFAPDDFQGVTVQPLVRFNVRSRVAVWFGRKIAGVL
jgi:acetyltransferase